jgi:predicted transport protein
MNGNYVKPERLWLQDHPELSERWVQSLIAADPSVLGLGDLVLRGQERIQPHAGRLDLLLQDLDTKRRYEVELQLGATDESHIIRTIEYWDIEKKRYPQYDHCAVLIAEDVTSRFLNILSLFNGLVPFIAIQMQALKVGECLTLIFTTVVNELSRGLVDEDEDAEAAPANRAYWEEHAAKPTMALTDELFTLVKQLDPSLELKFNKFYIGLSREGQPFNFVTFRPQKKHVVLHVPLPESDDLDSKIENAAIDTLDYDKRWREYRLRLGSEDIKNNSATLRELMQLAYQRRSTV